MLYHHLFQSNFWFLIHMVYLVHCSTDLLFFDIPLSYYCINFRLSVICCLFFFVFFFFGGGYMSFFRYFFINFNFFLTRLSFLDISLSCYLRSFLGLLLFDIPLLNYINLRSSVVFIFGDIYLSFSISLCSVSL